MSAVVYSVRLLGRVPPNLWVTIFCLIWGRRPITVSGTPALGRGTKISGSMLHRNKLEPSVTQTHQQSCTAPNRADSSLWEPRPSRLSLDLQPSLRPVFGWQPATPFSQCWVLVGYWWSSRNGHPAINPFEAPMRVNRFHCTIQPMIIDNDSVCATATFPFKQLAIESTKIEWYGSKPWETQSLAFRISKIQNGFWCCCLKCSSLIICVPRYEHNWTYVHL